MKSSGAGVSSTPGDADRAPGSRRHGQIVSTSVIFRPPSTRPSSLVLVVLASGLLLATGGVSAVRASPLASKPTWSASPSNDVEPGAVVTLSGTGCKSAGVRPSGLHVAFSTEFYDIPVFASVRPDGSWTFKTRVAPPDSYSLQVYAKCEPASSEGGADPIVFEYKRVVTIDYQYPLVLQVLPVSASVVKQFAGPVALFLFPRTGLKHFGSPVSASKFTATVDWGDGKSSQARIERAPSSMTNTLERPDVPPSVLAGYQVVGTHTYSSKQGTGKVTVTIHPPPGHLRETASNAATVTP